MRSNNVTIEIETSHDSGVYDSVGACQLATRNNGYLEDLMYRIGDSNGYFLWAYAGPHFTARFFGNYTGLIGVI